MKVLEVRNLKKYYGQGENKVKAIDNVSFSINKGEFVAVVGQSGSGKSTLLNLLGGLDRPSSGSVVINDNEIYKLDDDRLSIFRRRNIGFIFQFFNLIPVLDVEENIAFPTLLDNEKVDSKYLDEIINTLGLQKRRNHLPSELSGGQQQRVSIGRALINKPAIILADEPTGNLDSKTTKEVIDLLKCTAKKYNQTLILITHDEKVAEQADRVITVSDGKIIDDVYNA
ncbi:ABC transporter family protein [[Clostridium] bifermentans ATCC 638]|uniref:ABC transporter family protein n=1 Tax=Paraclostridium bifermentans ATCC 638 = DSM 14991 TaxID=1233171 RepID=T4VHM5_PARBF|nr:ABC transporter ATP-binding protein [Paraclostridium bifermentans]EQK43214.1 ABC transporter family protein [[Clostridium] bifermentans ATCC 638] [Paraclostridium bifermentans ATCC 638 = DSM 14991]RIZ60438.1 ABC transporter ATP-binding protein [Paraclostridium bifermentans]UAG17080.1 ABC transporter ATP-binding protein [Paraclostridium bifermentans]